MRNRRREQGVSGYLTVYLSLIMAVLLSLFLALVEGVRSNAIRMETECVTEIGLSSVLAEYHRELLNQYNLFAVDSSYGTTTAGYENVKQHLNRYLERNISQQDIFLADFFYRDFMAIDVANIEMTGASILTDETGEVFRRRAVEAVEDDANLTLFSKIQQWMRTVESNGLRENDIASQKQAVDDEIQSYDGKEIQISESEWSSVQIQNPTEELNEIRKKGILGLLVKEEEELSHKALHSENLIAARMERGEVSKGNIPVSEQSEGEELWERFLFQEYLMRYMGYYGAEKENGALAYQIEYLLSGKDSDIENLTGTVNQICFVREAANALYLFSDKEKCMEAEAVAIVLATLIRVPELQDAFKTTILLGWSFAESIYDMKQLFAGEEVPLLKDSESWHYSLENALQFGNDTDNYRKTSGMSYKDYLRLFMMFENKDTLTKRAMNMVEADIRLTSGNAAFRMDACYDEVRFRVNVDSKYGYSYEITRGKRY